MYRVTEAIKRFHAEHGFYPTKVKISESLHKELYLRSLRAKDHTSGLSREADRAYLKHVKNLEKHEIQVIVVADTVEAVA